MPPQDQRSMLERHFQSAGLAIILALMFWLFREVQLQSVTIAVMDARLATIEKQLGIVIDGKIAVREMRLRKVEDSILENHQRKIPKEF